MPFRLLEILEQYMIGAFLITCTQLEKTGSIVEVFIPLGHLKLFMSPSADEFHLNSKNALYLSASQ